MKPPIVWFDEIDSTNAEARRRGEAGETQPVWLAARRQSSGVGRRGRSWTSEPGNLFATLLTATDQPPNEAAQVSFVAALAVHDVVSGLGLDRPARLKWPNDLMIGEAKAGGILVESGRAGDNRHWLAVGIGLNLAHAPDHTETPATALARHAVQPPSPDVAMERLAAAMADRMGIWSREGFAPIAKAWTARAYGLGLACIARLPLETVAGVAEGLDSDGALRLRLPDESLCRITAGDVFFGDA